jgi:hypothetical protein
MGQKKKPLVEIAYEILTAMENFNGIIGNVYHVLETEDGERKLLVENQKDKTVRFVKEKKLRSQVLNYFREQPDSRNLLDHEAKSVAETCINLLRPLPEKPPMLSLLENKHELAFHRVPFELDDTLETPLFDELMSRTSNSEALRLFIGSLFVPHSDKSQYLYLFGHGRNGKGSMTRLLERVLGSCYATESIPDKRNRFWTSGLVAKRLVVFSEGEASDADFPSSGFFKALTGGDSVRIEEKGKSVYKANLDCKFIFLNNNKPVLKNNAADIRRAIFCEMGPIKSTLMDDYEQKLWDEAPGIIGKCYMDYLKLALLDKDKIIPVDPISLDDVTQVSDDTMQAIFDRLFFYTYDVQKMDRHQDYVTGPEMQDALRNTAGLIQTTARSEFLNWLQEKYKIKSKTFRNTNNQALRGFVGIRSKSGTFARNVVKTNNNIELIKN